MCGRNDLTVLNNLARRIYGYQESKYFDINGFDTGKCFTGGKGQCQQGEIAEGNREKGV